MVRDWILLAIALAGCEVVEPVGGVLEPARVAPVDAGIGAPPVPPKPSSTGAPDEDGFDFEAYKAEQREADGVSEPAAPGDLLAELGADDVVAPPDPGPAPAAAVAPAPSASAPFAGPPIQAVEVSMGVRLVTTLDGTVPPRAVIGLPDGRERVVQAGDMIPEARVVVLAIGRDLVQVAQVRPQGDHAAIEPVFLRSLFPRGSEPR